MGNILIRILIFLLSSFLVLGLLYYRVKIIHLQQIILILIVVLIVALRALRHSAARKVVTNWLLVFIITFFVQLLIASTGAVFSPFFVLIHLHVIGLSLFFDFWTAFSFLVLELAVLVLNINLDQNLFYLVKGDFGSVLLYFASILVITPISKFISQQYHIKSDTLKMLFKELSAQEQIIDTIDDFVLTTDKNLTILSANEAAKKNVDLSKNNSLITDCLDLVDEKGKRLTKEALLTSLAPLTEGKRTDPDKLNLIIKGYTLKLPDKKTPLKMIIRVTPVLGQNGNLEKLIFLIGQTGGEEGWSASGSKLQQAHRKYLSIMNILTKDPIISKLTTINLYLNILKKYEIDMLVASELNLYPDSLKIKLADILRISARILKQYQSLGQKLNIDYKLNLADDLQEEYRLIIADNTLPESLMGTSSLSVTTDPGLLQILIEKIVDIVTSIAYAGKESLLLADKKGLVELEITPVDDSIKVAISTRLNPKSKDTIEGLLDINSNKLEVLDNLTLSSGLESYLIKSITGLLDISFKAEYNQYNSQLNFNISVNKYFNRTH